MLRICALISDYCFWSQKYRQRGRNIVVVPPPIVSLPLRLKWLSGHLKGWHTFLLPVSVISLSPFGSQTLKTRIFKNNCILESDCTCGWLRRAEKLSLHLRLMLGTETIYNWKKKKTKHNNKNKNPIDVGNQISRDATLLDLNIQFSTITTKWQDTQRNGKI